MASVLGPPCTYRYTVQPNNVEMLEYGRLVIDGELKVKCDGETSQNTRYVHDCPEKLLTKFLRICIRLNILCVVLNSTRKKIP